MPADSDVDAAVAELVAELDRERLLTRRRMYEVSLTHLGEDECSDLEGKWAIPLPVLARFRERRPAGAKWNVDEETWVLQ